MNLFHLYFVIVLFFIIFLLLYQNFDKIERFFFRSESDEPENIDICPKCGSVNWKFPNPLKPSESIINLYQLVNVIRECIDCGFIGMFYNIDKTEIGKIKIDYKIGKGIKFGYKKEGIVMAFVISFLFALFIYFLA